MQDVCSRVGLDASLLLAELETADTAARRPSVALAALEITNTRRGGGRAPGRRERGLEGEEGNGRGIHRPICEKCHPRSMHYKLYKGLSTSVGRACSAPVVAKVWTTTTMGLQMTERRDI